MRAAALLLLAVACDTASGGPARFGSAAPTPAPLTDRAAIESRAHAALVSNCGECHEGHRPTAKPEALAIFDLDDPLWATRFTPPRLDTALRRFASKPAADRAAFEAFTHLSR